MMNESKTIREFLRAVHLPVAAWFQGVFVGQVLAVKFAENISENTSYTAYWYAKPKQDSGVHTWLIVLREGELHPAHFLLLYTPCAN